MVTRTKVLKDYSLPQGFLLLPNCTPTFLGRFSAQLLLIAAELCFDCHFG
jgi:hypothetical protein